MASGSTIQQTLTAAFVARRSARTRLDQGGYVSWSEANALAKVIKPDCPDMSGILNGQFARELTDKSVVKFTLFSPRDALALLSGKSDDVRYQVIERMVMLSGDKMVMDIPEGWVLVSRRYYLPLSKKELQAARLDGEKPLSDVTCFIIARV
jgi:hypothetical protein